MFLMQQKTSKDSKQHFPFTLADFFFFCLTECLHLLFIVNSAFPNKKNLAQKLKFIYDKQRANVSQNSMFQVNRTKNATRKRCRASGNQAANCQLFMRRTTKKTFFHALGELTENKKALLFFSGKVTIQTFNSSI